MVRVSRSIGRVGRALARGVAASGVALALLTAGAATGHAAERGDAVVAGLLFVDENGNSQFDAGEKPVANTKVFITVDFLEVGKPTTVEVPVGADGRYTHTVLLLNEYALIKVQFPMAGNAQFPGFEGGPFVTPLVGAVETSSKASKTGAASFTVDYRTFTAAKKLALASMNAGYERTYTVGGRAWQDGNVDGIQEQNEPGLQGQKVWFEPVDGTPIPVVTDADGQWRVPNIAKNQKFVVRYEKQFASDPKPGFLSPALVGSDRSVDSDVTSGTDGRTSVMVAGPSGEGARDPLLHVDAAYPTAPTMIGGRIWADLNGDGLMDQGEPPAPGAKGVCQVKGGDLIAFTANADGLWRCGVRGQTTVLVKFLGSSKLSPSRPLGSNWKASIPDPVNRAVEVNINTPTRSLEYYSPCEPTPLCVINAGFTDYVQVGGRVWIDSRSTGSARVMSPWHGKRRSRTDPRAVRPAS